MNSNNDEPFKVIDGMVYVSNAFITDSLRVKDRPEARCAVEGIVRRYITGEGTEYADDMVDELMVVIGQRDLHEQVMGIIRGETRPGGIIHNAMKR